MVTQKIVPIKDTTYSSIIYLFTWSPKDQNTLNPKFKYIDDIANYFRQWHQCMKEFEVNPEFNQNGNLHYHGYFRIKDQIKWFKRILPKMKYNGYIKINKVHTSFDEAIKYTRKDREVMTEVLYPLKVPYTEKDKEKQHIPNKEDSLLDYGIEINIPKELMNNNMN